jgi:NTE family protein
MFKDQKISLYRRRMMGGALAAPLLGRTVDSKIAHAHTPASGRSTKGLSALVLGGGGCRGIGHIGFIQGLETQNIKPDLIVGSSVGSLVGALYAGGVSGQSLERLAHQVSRDTFRDWIFPTLGIFGGNRIAEFVREYVSVRTIEALPIRFAAVATDLQTGRPFVFTQGDLGLAVQASSTLPGLIEPVYLRGRYYVDGNLTSPVPVDVARELGATTVIAVDVSFPPEQADLRDPIDALYQAFSILTRKLALDDRARADLAIEPKLPIHNDMSSATLDALVAAGRHAAADAMPSIKRLFTPSR